MRRKEQLRYGCPMGDFQLWPIEAGSMEPPAPPGSCKVLAIRAPFITGVAELTLET